MDASAAKRARTVEPESFNFLYDNVIAINYLLDDIWVLFVSNSDRWHSIVVEKRTWSSIKDREGEITRLEP